MFLAAAFEKIVTPYAALFISVNRMLWVITCILMHCFSCADFFVL